MSRCFAAVLPFMCSALVSAAPSERPELAEPEKPKRNVDVLNDWRLEIGQSRALSFAIPELVPSPGAGAAASELTRILVDDISFASVVRITEPKTYPRISKTKPIDYYAWEAAGADILITGSVSKRTDGLVARIAIHAVLNEEVIFESQFTSATASVREFGHHVSDSILAKFGVMGVSRTRIAFASDRRDGRKALHLMDYDGYGQRAATQNRHLDFQPRFSPDGRTLSFISYPRKKAPPVLAVLNGEPLFKGPGMIFSASWSPDGEHIAFSATRDEPGNAEIYVMQKDGTRIRRLTHHPGIDVSPTWSPTGRAIAFTSNRTGSPQIYTMDAEGLNLRRVSIRGSYNAEPAWSPYAAFDEIAYASRVRGGVFDIVVHDVFKNEIRVLTSGEGLNESPQWSPNGLHLVFTSTRTGTPQVFTMNRDGSNVRQLTSEGENHTPSWSPLPRR